MSKITVHEKVLGHLSRGLYRSPASAMRELVSNAWDANATHVRIDTNFPNFFQISVQDNGCGFTRDAFERLMSGGIGDSLKRPQQEALIHDRPVIGRLGIGMLGIAQICGGFLVTSRPRVGQGFQARVRLYDLLKEKLDEDDPSVIGDREVGEIDVGEYEFQDFDPSTIGYGTLIIADDIQRYSQKVGK